MLNMKIICVGRMKFHAQAANEYEKRLRGLVKLQISEIPEIRLPDGPSEAQIFSALLKEGALISSMILERSFSVAMCIEGKTLSSAEFAETLAGLTVKGVSHVCFIVGGSFGLHDSVKKRSDMLLSMSSMTFPHHLARVMLLEQIYRAVMINSGSKYHK